MADKEIKKQFVPSDEILKELENRLFCLSKAAGVDELQRTIVIYKLASSGRPMAKYARDLIAIRKELGESPEIVAVESKFARTEFDVERAKFEIREVDPSIAKVEESMLKFSEMKLSKKSEIIRRTLYSILALANLAFLSKYTEFKDLNAIGFYSLITFWTSLFALGNSASDYIVGDGDYGRIGHEYYTNLDDLINRMEEKGISPDDYALTKKRKSQK